MIARWAHHRLAALFVALAIVFGGNGPALALQPSSDCASMPAMGAMHMDGVKSDHTMPMHQKAPCKNMQSGCIAGQCFGPVVLVPSTIAASLSFTVDKGTWPKAVVRDALSLRPPLPPPIVI